MVNSVQSRPDHYAALGLAPTASDAEIAHAFAGKMRLSSARPVGEVARILAAYEVLRDPAKRGDYDRSLKAKAKPRPEARAHQWTAAVQPRWPRPFIAAAAAGSAAQGGGDAQAPEPHVTTEPQRNAAAAKPTTSIGAALHELAKPSALSGTSTLGAPPEQRRREKQDADPVVEQLVRHMMAFEQTEEEKSRDAKPRSPAWRSPLLAVGGFVLGAGLLGALAGLSVKDSANSAQAAPAAAAPRPAAKPQVAAPPPPIQSDALVLRQAERPVRVGMASPRLRHGVSRQRASGWAEPAGQPLATEAVASVVEPAGAANPPVQAVAADLPLSHHVVARTLDRIGYRCGEVTATAQGEAPGTYTVTCASGQSYRAAPVGGRYRFKRLGIR
jgi:curved DNA-binding protein CbpA